MCKKWLFTYFNLLFLCMLLQVINKVKVTHQGHDHKSRLRSNQCQGQIEVIFKERYSYAGGLHLVLVLHLVSRFNVWNFALYHCSMGNHESRPCMVWKSCYLTKSLILNSPESNDQFWSQCGKHGRVFVLWEHNSRSGSVKNLKLPFVRLFMVW